ncbi:radical SAM protein [Aliifodinibius sp. S!AR15-10]|uniref:radical SAM protein n=1 Tax=Aliifodinibius sp. S!AR15-10 TaxID=2950437 RepID=UPI002854FC8B|nr:radical SAM protein [Aliifodinibius sp. S!AR15-10]MDR8389827.1 radical SAM protein [Aliifodinibius sp. S!AR15-10]
MLQQAPEYIKDPRWQLSRDDFVPAYLKLYEINRSVFEERIEEGLKVLKNCEVCPRDCNVDRTNDEHGICRTGRFAYVGSYFPHFGEEDCLRGWNGSGTIFFSFCNLKCVFCQNHELSWEGAGQTVTPDRLSDMMIELQERGCHNINFVTPEHVVPQVLEAIPPAIEKGLRLPIVYNTSAFDSLHSLELMEDIVDIYMPDFKFWDPDLSRFYTTERRYPEVARAVVKEMHQQVGDLKFDENGLALRGLIVRHLVMPNGTGGAEEIFRFLTEEISEDTYVTVMDQYRPDAQVTKKPDRYEKISRRTSRKEFRKAKNAARQAGLYRLDERWRNPRSFRKIPFF